MRDEGNIEEAAESEDSDEEEDRPEEGLREADLRRDSSEEMKREIGTMIDQAKANGLPLIYQDALQSLVHEFDDVFRLELGLDPPARVQPLEIELIDETLPERRGGRPR